MVTIKRPEETTIPNVVTANGDGKNDHFLLPSDVEGCSILICNRWGEQVFYAKEYQNNWPSERLSAGFYFYTLQGECLPMSKGIIHVMN